MKVPPRRLRIALLGTRGVPATYGGFETAIEEIGRRLVERGHEVTVYCRRNGKPELSEHLGMKLVFLPALHHRVLETLSHTACSVLHATLHSRPDVAFVFNAANAPFVPLLRARGIPTAVHVDGLEWKRDKWGGMARRYYRWAEQFSVLQADALIADAQGIADYYQQEFDIPTELITYGTHILTDTALDKLATQGLESGKFHLVVARFEPENHVDVIIRGFLASQAALPLVVVGSAPYALEHTRQIKELAGSDARVRLMGAVWDQELLDQLYAHAATYLHGHSVGGTNPSLLRAMGAGTAAIAWDVVFNREVLGAASTCFRDPATLANLIEAAERSPENTQTVGRDLQSRARELYDWDKVTLAYEALAVRLQAGYSTHGMSQGRTTDPAGDRPEALQRGPSPIHIRGSES
ncbi:glycosyltransferase [Cryobacterium psychrophilum]|uniref:D-inositol 3-phosphate glycosyltransferase n=1 Tax=Cryobacterium psychrophilum TaxID=41988 RepID=A0A4Y8KRC6_9MICO|nr:DUF1972 domain-containing protein [Cryobacterium psychrophilum]TDW29952.1 glycosyltransferase involved in cell wall biosynthesis [Cryobacterium psychrophilum]TFD76515.1 glycosyltransferase family 1 protein [Cryobacterium psychrophilum]